MIFNFFSKFDSIFFDFLKNRYKNQDFQNFDIVERSLNVI